VEKMVRIIIGTIEAGSEENTDKSLANVLDLLTSTPAGRYIYMVLTQE
jgi:hypothetical protein